MWGKGFMPKNKVFGTTMWNFVRIPQTLFEAYINVGKGIRTLEPTKGQDISFTSECPS